MFSLMCHQIRKNNINFLFWFIANTLLSSNYLVYWLQYMSKFMQTNTTLTSFTAIHFPQNK